jgi:hypothetical protein
MPPRVSTGSQPPSLAGRSPILPPRSRADRPFFARRAGGVLHARPRCRPCRHKGARSMLSRMRRNRLDRRPWSPSPQMPGSRSSSGRSAIRFDPCFAPRRRPVNPSFNRSGSHGHNTMLAAEPIVELLLTLGLILLAMSSLNLLALMLARLLMPARRLVTVPTTDDPPPTVLVQLPLFNEGELVDRVLEAVMALDWPKDRLQIQVLDDSTDDFSLSLSQRAVAKLRREGVQIELLHRIKRTAFKAGALAAGLERSDAEFVAIFDADFMPPSDFLRQDRGSPARAARARLCPGALGAHQPGRQPAHPHPGAPAGFALPGRAGGALAPGSAGPLQRDLRCLASPCDRGRRRLAGRHAHGGPGPESAGPSTRVGVPVS